MKWRVPSKVSESPKVVDLYLKGAVFDSRSRHGQSLIFFFPGLPQDIKADNIITIPIMPQPVPFNVLSNSFLYKSLHYSTLRFLLSWERRYMEFTVKLVHPAQMANTMCPSTKRWLAKRNFNMGNTKKKEMRNKTLQKIRFAAGC